MSMLDTGVLQTNKTMSLTDLYSKGLHLFWSHFTLLIGSLNIDCAAGV